MDSAFNPNIDGFLFKRIYGAIRENDLDALNYIFASPSSVEYLGWEKWEQWTEGWEIYPVENSTPLEIATELRNLEMIKVLLEVGCSLPDWRFPLGRALQIVCKKGDLELVRIFLKAKADIGHTKSTAYMKDSSFLEAAIYGGHLEIIKILIEFGFDPDGTEGGITPLMVASLANNLSIVKYLVLIGADVNQTDDSGWITALVHAAYYAHQEVFDYLESLSSPEAVRIARENFGKFAKS